MTPARCYNLVVINSLLVKPAGPDCNLRCNYCFYRQKTGLFGGKQHRMSERLLEALISQSMAMGVTAFSWQGGEPALMGLNFFKRVVELQIRYGVLGTSVANAFQTNGTLLNAEWARFFAEYNFLVGLSIDGPAGMHDYYRKDVSGRGTHKRVMDLAKLLRDNGVEFNVLVLINDVNVKEPDAVWDFFKSNEFMFLQFVPCVEPGGKGVTASFSITPEAFGEFLVAMFDRWIEDFPNVSVRDFDDMLARELGLFPGTCTVSERCGSYVVVEHNGDVFACDFFVTAKWRLGNMLHTPLAEIVASHRLREFARAKSIHGKVCLTCEYLSWCHGGCQKHRVVLGGELTDPSYFCKSYKMLFEHALPKIPELVQRLRSMGCVYV
ncbi:MAG: anaerobic sulfatase maturase [Armatimonadetes bacterium]|nr:anaerobic sulfatase maturase [Armatimonadota bacterium]